MATKITTGLIDSGAITSALIANASITADDLHTTLDLTGKTVTVATATAGDNDTSVASTAFVATAIANLADSAPETLNTLNELAAALGDDANFSTTVTNSIALKAPLASPTFTGTITGTLATAAQTNITSVGTLTGLTTTGDINFGDDDKAVFGAGSDLQIYHNSADNSSYIRELGAGNLKILGDNVQITNAAGTENQIFSASDGSVYLYHNGVAKFETTATGINVPQQVQVVGSGDSILLLNTASDAGDKSLIKFGDNSDADAGYIDYDHGTNTLSFGANALERMRIDSSGNVGIGTDSPSAATPLTVYYSDTSQFNIGGPQSGISNNVYYNGSAYVNRNTGAGGSLLQMSTDGSFAFRRATSGSPPALSYSMYIDGSGNVGIDDTDPPSLLTVTGTNTGFVTSNGAGISGIQISRTTTSGENLYMYTSSGTGWSGSSYVGRVQSYGNNAMEIGAQDNAPVSFATNNTERLRIHQEGYLEIPKYSSNADNTDTDTHRKIEFFANGSGVATYKRDCFVQRATGNTQYHWYKIFIGGSAYGRGTNIKYTANWSTEHAAGQGMVDGSLITGAPHYSAEVSVHGHIVYSRQTYNGSYYGWTDTPDITVYHSSASGTSGGLYMRVSGYRASGYDGGTVHSIYLEIFGSEQNISNQGIYYTGSSTPSDLGAVVSRTILS
jgi:hypothetical protein